MQSESTIFEQIKCRIDVQFLHVCLIFKYIYIIYIYIYYFYITCILFPSFAAMPSYLLS